MTFIRHCRESSFSICKKNSQIMVTEVRLQTLTNCLNCSLTESVSTARELEWPGSVHKKLETEIYSLLCSPPPNFTISAFQNIDIKWQKKKHFFQRKLSWKQHVRSFCCKTVIHFNHNNKNSVKVSERMGVDQLGKYWLNSAYPA